jgi:DNA-binding transcriptional LysR family regulator
LDLELLHAQNEGPRRTVLLANSSALAGPLGEAIAELVAPVAERPLLVRESASEATVQALRSGSADVGIVSDAVETRGLLARELAPDPLVLAVPRKHPLAARTSVPFAEALAQPWVAWGELGALSTHLQMHALALGARIQAQATFPTVDGVLRLVAAGVGITVLPQSVLGRWTDAEAVARAGRAVGETANAGVSSRRRGCVAEAPHGGNCEAVAATSGWPAGLRPAPAR